MHQQETLQCPECGHEQETTIWTSLNVSLEPDTKQKLFEGEINFFKCGECGATALIDVPFHYHDMHREFYVQYVPFKLLDNDDTYSDFNADGFPSLEGLEGIPEDSYWHTIHVVFDMGELVRYVIFRERLAELKNGCDPQEASEGEG